MKDDVVAQLAGLFQQYPDRYELHKVAAPVIEAASRDSVFLYDIIRANLSDPAFLARKRHYSTLSMTIAETPSFSFMLNIFPPLPQRATDSSFQSIHHHGSLLLTTVGAFGPGYSSMVFKKGFRIDPQTGITRMELEKTYQNGLGKAEFVDSRQPHIVFYPADFSATYAFWCDDRASAKEMLKKYGPLTRLKKPLAKIVRSLGLSRYLGLNKVEYFDFYVENGKVIALKERLSYEVSGDNENFLQNIFCFVQQTGFNDRAFLEALLTKDGLPAPAIRFIHNLLDGVPVPDAFYEGHLNIDKVNISKDELAKAFPV
jgi:hypothetical protein